MYVVDTVTHKRKMVYQVPIGYTYLLREHISVQIAA